jgi:hypothetical protein
VAERRRILPDNRTGRRFPVNLPIQFQLEDSAKKQKGTTRDLSASGVYITAAAPFRVGSKVTFQICVPGELVGSKKNVDIECRGHVVRVDAPARATTTRRGAPDGVACVIDTYKFVRK